MEGFSAYNYNQYQYVEEGSPATDTGSLSPPPEEEFMLAAFHPKKRAGRKKFKETRHPVYRGIRQRNSGKWVCEVREPNKQSRIWLGTFPTDEMAARAHDVAAIALRGRAACLNFADSAWRLPVPASSNTKDIQRAAAQAAELFRPQSKPAEEEGAAAASQEWKGEEKSEGVSFMDEDDLFGMPEILVDMYNGMLLPPPTTAYMADDYVEYDVDLPLWNY